MLVPPPALPTAYRPPPALGAEFYNNTVGDAPPGMEWWNYRNDVPPLPTPYDYFLSSTNASFAEQFRT